MNHRPVFNIEKFSKLIDSIYQHLPSHKLTKEQIINWLLKNNLKFNQRPETLTVSDWINLTKSFNF
jgi:hypothetical protein